MEFILSFLLIFVGVIWIFGKVFPRILIWYIQRRVKKMGGDGANFSGFGGNGFAGFGGVGGNYGEEAAKRAKEEEILRSKEQEGKVTIMRTQEQEKVIERGFGEYVDYEEKK